MRTSPSGSTRPLVGCALLLQLLLGCSTTAGVDAGVNGGVLVPDAGAPAEDGGAEAHDAGADCAAWQPAEEAGFSLRCPSPPEGCAPTLTVARTRLVHATGSTYAVSAIAVDGGLLVAQGEPGGVLVVQRLDEALQPSGEAQRYGSPSSSSHMLWETELLRTGDILQVQTVHQDLKGGAAAVGSIPVHENGMPAGAGSSLSLESPDGGRPSVGAHSAAAPDGGSFVTAYHCCATWNSTLGSPQISAMHLLPGGEVLAGPMPVLSRAEDGGTGGLTVESLVALPDGRFVVAANESAEGHSRVRVQPLSGELTAAGPEVLFPAGAQDWSRQLSLDWAQPQLVPLPGMPDGGGGTLALSYRDIGTDGRKHLVLARDALGVAPTEEVWAVLPEGQVVVHALGAGRAGPVVAWLAMQPPTGGSSTYPIYRGRLFLAVDGTPAVDITASAEALPVDGYSRDRIRITPLSGDAMLVTAPLAVPDGGVDVEAWRVCLP